MIDFTTMEQKDLMAFWFENQRGSVKKCVALFGRRLFRPILAVEAVSAYAANLNAYRIRARMGDKTGMDCYRGICGRLALDAIDAGVGFTVRWDIR